MSPELAAIVRMLAAHAVNDYLAANSAKKQTTKILEFVPCKDECACSASALPPAFRKEVK